jgi:hypothetical protein
MVQARSQKQKTKKDLEHDSLLSAKSMHESKSVIMADVFHYR